MKTKQILLRPRWLLLFLLFAYLLVTPPPEARAQSTAEFAPIGAKWSLLIVSNEEGKDEYHHSPITILGDTLIDGNICKKMSDMANTLTGILHQKNDTVKFVENGVFFPLYIFNANEGDNWDYSFISYDYVTQQQVLVGKITVTVDSIAIVPVNGKNIRRQYVSSEWIYRNVEWLGTEENPFYDTYFWKWIDFPSGAYPLFTPLLIPRSADNPVFRYVHCYEDAEYNIQYEAFTNEGQWSYSPDIDCDATSVGLEEETHLTPFYNGNILLFEDLPTTDIEACIYTLDGKLIHKTPDAPNNQLYIDTSYLHSGIYLTVVRQTKNGKILYKQIILK